MSSNACRTSAWEKVLEMTFQPAFDDGPDDPRERDEQQHGEVEHAHRHQPALHQAAAALALAERHGGAHLGPGRRPRSYRSSSSGRVRMRRVVVSTTMNEIANRTDGDRGRLIELELAGELAM